MQERLNTTSDGAGRHDTHAEETEGILPIIVVLLALAAVVVLFLLFKFNLFNGGKAPSVKDTLGAGISWLVLT
jgi:predicted ABC-type sugar transport system permease subunit